MRRAAEPSLELRLALCPPNGGQMFAALYTRSFSALRHNVTSSCFAATLNFMEEAHKP